MRAGPKRREINHSIMYAICSQTSGESKHFQLDKLINLNENNLINRQIYYENKVNKIQK